MKLGIVATSDTNPYATALTARLIQRGQKPACIILAEEPAWHRLFAYVRVAGIKATLRRIAGQYRRDGLPDRDARFHLREYAAAHGLADWDSPLTILAAKHAIQLTRVDTLHDPGAVDCVRANALDLLLNTAGVIFKPPLLRSPRMGMLNAHMARLPRFRGMNVLEWTLWFKETPGITVHFVTPGIDLGDILEFRDIPIADPDTIAGLRAKSYPVMVETMTDCVAALAENRQSPTPQRADEGRQFFVMHPQLLAVTEQRLSALKRH